MSVGLLGKFPTKPRCIFHWRKFSTIFSSPVKRQGDFDTLDQTKMTLLHVLTREAGREYGFSNRSDGFVSVKRLLSHPEFQFLDMDQLQDIVSQDRKHRFTLEFDPGKGDDAWWIKAKPWHDFHWVMKPVFAKDWTTSVVYATTLEEWETHISQHGILRQERDWIEVYRGIPTDEYLQDLEERRQVFIFLNLRKSIFSGIRFFVPTPAGQKWVSYTPLITKGDEAGRIPPSLFHKVEHLTARKRLLWGHPQPLESQGWVRFNENSFDEFGQRVSFLGVISGVAGFARNKIRLNNVPDVQQTGLREEAAAVMQLA